MLCEQHIFIKMSGSFNSIIFVDLWAITVAFFAPVSRYPSSESFVFERKEYSLRDLRVSWNEALVICQSFDAELAIFENDRHLNFLTKTIAESSIDAEEVWIDGRWNAAANSSWITTKQKSDMEIEKLENISARNSFGSKIDGQCLALGRKAHEIPVFVNLSCKQQRPFVCRKEHRVSGLPVPIEPTVRVGDEEFTVFLARVTWSDAVTYCREQRLVIAEVRSLAEAQVLSMMMLRARPSGLESAWIGGYAKDSTWHWIVSGDLIQDNELWGATRKPLFGCLMLDRHLGQLPTYIAARCYRNRDFICQKSRRSDLDGNPVATTIDGCRYWVGLSPLDWRAARNSCAQLNASLLVLDSPLIIVHAMSLLAESFADTRHAWTDGHRVALAHEEPRKHWIWESTKERIPRIGESFLPWIEDLQYVPGTDCLNLDRGIGNIPIVYGLGCDNRQPYICQPLFDECRATRMHDKMAASAHDKMAPSAHDKMAAGARDLSAAPPTQRPGPESSGRIDSSGYRGRRYTNGPETTAPTMLITSSNIPDQKLKPQVNTQLAENPSSSTEISHRSSASSASQHTAPEEIATTTVRPAPHFADESNATFAPELRLGLEPEDRQDYEERSNADEEYASSGITQLSDSIKDARTTSTEIQEAEDRILPTLTSSGARVSSAYSLSQATDAKEMVYLQDKITTSSANALPASAGPFETADSASWLKTTTNQVLSQSRSKVALDSTRGTSIETEPSPSVDAFRSRFLTSTRAPLTSWKFTKTPKPTSSRRRVEDKVEHHPEILPSKADHEVTGNQSSAEESSGYNKEARFGVAEDKGDELEKHPEVSLDKKSLRVSENMSSDEETPSLDESVKRLAADAEEEGESNCDSAKEFDSTTDQPRVATEYPSSRSSLTLKPFYPYRRIGTDFYKSRTIDGDRLVTLAPYFGRVPEPPMITAMRPTDRDDYAKPCPVTLPSAVQHPMNYDSKTSPYATNGMDCFGKDATGRLMGENTGDGAFGASGESEAYDVDPSLLFPEVQINLGMEEEEASLHENPPPPPREIKLTFELDDYA